MRKYLENIEKMCKTALFIAKSLHFWAETDHFCQKRKESVSFDAENNSRCCEKCFHIAVTYLLIVFMSNADVQSLFQTD
jgi:hypothetical protein